MAYDERLVALLETEAIRIQIVRLARYMDERRWDEYSALFTDDGTLELPFGSSEGPAAIRARVEADLSNYTATQHLNSNYDIEVRGDTASARASFIATHVTTADGTGFWSGGGAYHLELREIAGVWRIERLIIKPAWRNEQTAALPATDPGSEERLLQRSHPATPQRNHQ
jgi:3-phenylpropionate/cinnamic acid dioxygenase small subunit